MLPQVLGVDPSLSGTGLAWADTSTSTCGGAGDQRLWVIYRTVRLHAEPNSPPAIDESLESWGRADLAVVEDLPTHGMGAGKTGMAQGVVRLALMAAQVPYVLVPPATLKTYACGKGNATKPDMRVSLLQRTGFDVRDDNQCDAAWLRMLGLDYLGAAVVTLPQGHRRALDKLTWPVAV